MTTYIVLDRDSEQDQWQVVGRVDARSAKSAVREAIGGSDDAEGMFVAVPARSWRHVTVKVETKTALRFS
jgi:hypothetical protein